MNVKKIINRNTKKHARCEQLNYVTNYYSDVQNLEDILQSPPSDLEEKFGLMTKAGGKTEECWRKGAMIWRRVPYTFGAGDMAPAFL